MVQSAFMTPHRMKHTFNCHLIIGSREVGPYISNRIRKNMPAGFRLGSGARPS